MCSGAELLEVRLQDMEKTNERPPLVLVISRDNVQAARRSAEINLASWRAAIADDLTDAMASLRREHASLVLVIPPIDDLPAVDMPAILREIEPFGYLPIVIQAQRPGEDVRCAFLKRGADDVITAETSGQELEARLHSLLRVKELHDQLATSRAALQRALDSERKLLIKLKRDNANLQELCTTDPLTRVQNVRSFWNILEHEFKMARRYDQPLSLLMLDLDHFKLVNDLHGHPAGDYVLKELTVVLTRCIRDSDVVARTGGEEFSIVLPRTDPRRCAVLAERIRREVSAHSFAAYGRLMHVTVSIGSSSFPADAEVTEPKLLTYLADQALLSAKESGRDRVVPYHSLPAAARRRLCRQFQQEREAKQVEATATECR